MKTSSSQPRRKKKEEHGFDGALNERGTGIGIVLLSPEGVILTKLTNRHFRQLTFVAEYEAFIAGLTAAQQLQAASIKG